MKNYRKTLGAVLTLALILGIFPVTALAEGSYGVSTQYIELQPGETAEVVISADNAAGKVQWSSDGPVSAAGDGWIDSSSTDGTQTITITADSIGEGGTGYVNVYADDVATFSGEQLTNGYTIQVVVAADPSNTASPSTVQDNPPQQQAEAPQDDAPQEYAPQEYVAQDDVAQEHIPQEEVPQEEIPQDAAAEQAAPAADYSELTDGNTAYAELSEEDRMYTTVNNIELYIIRYPRWIDEAGNEVWNDEIMNLDMLSGFDLVTVNYKGVAVDTFQKDDYMIFVLKNLETDVSGYYVLNNGIGFEQLSYITANGRQYIVVDFPADFEVPEGYQMVEMNLGTTKIHALKQITDTSAPADVATDTQAEEAPAPAAEEEIPAQDVPADGSLSTDGISRSAKIVVDPRIEVMLNGYETLVSPGLETEDPADDIYYIYCLVDGKRQLYSYDAAEGTLQRASITVYKEIPTEPQTVIVYQEKTVEVQPETTLDNSGGFLKGIGWGNMQIQVKVLLIALAVAILLIIILIILFAAMSRRNKKRNRKSSKSRVRSAIPPRSSGRTAPLNMDDETFFSYVKTDEDYDSYRR